MPLSSRVLWPVLGCLFVLMTGCSKGEQLPSLPAGPQTITGSLIPAEITFGRRGTHRFLQNDRLVYMAESSEVNLRKYENKTVVVTGTLSPNTDPSALPVLRITQVADVIDISWKKWDILSLGIRFEAPELWLGTTLNAEAEFSVPGGTRPLVTMELVEKEPALLTGVPIVVAQTRAVRSLNEQTGTQTVAVEREDGQFILVHFDPREQPSPERRREEWLRLLRSIEWVQGLPLSDSPPVTGTGSGIGAPCGGPAGVLCPDGYYCDIVDLQENIGRCRLL